MNDREEFLRPKEVIEFTKAHRSGGMPHDVIGVAADCSGNMFGFRRQSSPSDDAPVFLDHELVEARELAASFDALLEWYLDHSKGPEPTNG